MRRKTAITQELADLLRKYAIDEYCDSNAMLLSIQVVSDLENIARSAKYQK